MIAFFGRTSILTQSSPLYLRDNFHHSLAYLLVHRVSFLMRRAAEALLGLTFPSLGRETRMTQ